MAESERAKSNKVQANIALNKIFLHTGVSHSWDMK